MDRLKQEIEDARKEQAEIKNKQKWAMDSWVKLTKEMTALPSGHADLKKKERDCENAAQLVKQLNENLAQNESVLQRLSQNLLFFFEENLQGVVPSSKKPRTESMASGSGAPEASTTASSKGKDSSTPITDSGLNGFRKNILGYCHKSHGVGDDIEVWREKLPKTFKRAEKKLPKDKVESFQKIVSNMNSIDEVQKNLILWYVDTFPHERKPQGYYDAAGVTPPKKKSSGKKTEGEDGEEKATKVSAPSGSKPSKPAQSTATPSTSKASSSSSSKKQQAPVSPSSSSSSDDSSSDKGDSSSTSSSSSEEETVQKKKTPQTKTKVAEESSKKKKEEEPKKKDKKEETSASSKKKPKVEEVESEEEEKDKKKHHHHKKSAVLEAVTASGKKSKA